MKMEPIDIRPKGNMPWHPRFTGALVVTEGAVRDDVIKLTVSLDGPLKRGRVGFRRWFRSLRADG